MRARTIGLLAVFLVGGAESVVAQNKDLNGTWVGATNVPTRRTKTS